MLKISNIQVTETSAVEPVTLIEAKAWIVDVPDEHDDLVTSMVTGAVRLVQKKTHLQLFDSTVTGTVTVTSSNIDKWLYLFDYAPTRSAVSNLVITKLANGETPEAQTLNDHYYFDERGLAFVSEGTYGISYDISAAEVPEDLKEAIKIIVAYRYAHRGDQEKQHGMPPDTQEIIHSHARIYV